MKRFIPLSRDETLHLKREHTGPRSFNGPLVKEDEFAFAVVNGRLAFHLTDVCDLAETVAIFHTDSEKKLVQNLLGPGCDITLCPAVKCINGIRVQRRKYWHPVSRRVQKKKKERNLNNTCLERTWRRCVFLLIRRLSSY